MISNGENGCPERTGQLYPLLEIKNAFRNFKLKVGNYKKIMV